jgi:hypothetical protein
MAIPPITRVPISSPSATPNSTIVIGFGRGYSSNARTKV